MGIAWLGSFVDLIFPRQCSACGDKLLAGEEEVCIPCLSDLPYLNSLWGQQRGSGQSSLSAFIELDAQSLLEYEKSGRTQNLIHSFKYQGRKELAFYMGRHMGQKFGKYWKSLGVDAVVPVPLSPAKLKKRKYNQAERLAAGIERETGIICLANFLLRTGISESQTLKSRYERWVNVQSVFTLNLSGNSPHHVLLVDDVITTGSTIEACAACIRSDLDCKVSACSLARTA